MSDRSIHTAILVHDNIAYALYTGNYTKNPISTIIEAQSRRLMVRLVAEDRLTYN